jgi:hypothetical protein
MSGNLLMYGQMRLTTEIVTPEIAAKWLKLDNVNNRRVRKGQVSQYARDMNAGKWERKPLAICFCEDGSLGNGQHTLGAIVESGEPQELLIARNVPPKAIAVMDVGLRRTLSDIAHFVGSDFDSKEAATARVLEFGPGDSARRSFSELFDAYEKHQIAIEWVLQRSSRTVGFSASSLAVYARASYHNDLYRIEEFMDVIKSGIVTSDADSAAIRLRDYCRATKGAGSSQGRIQLYQRTESALHAFLRRKPMTKLYGTEKELFPLDKDPVHQDLVR